jgi:hypothetical protein
MARSTRSNFAKAKIWTGTMTADVEGTIGGVAHMCFEMTPADVRRKVLDKMAATHERLIGLEAQRNIEAVNGSPA